MMRRWLALMGLLLGIVGVRAQSELAATLEVLSAGVSVQRVNTATFLDVTQEAIVGVGDTIRTDGTGRARITFFDDGTDTELLPDTEYVIETFRGDEDSFQLSAVVLIGQTIQRLGRLIDAGSSYDIRTPGMTLAARGTVFALRVEDTGRSAMLVSEGTVESQQGSEQALVPTGFGVRAEPEEGLSDVVQASTFEELDAALDGCTATLTTTDDVSLNVRQAPGSDSALVGIVSAGEVVRVFGTVEGTGWYRIAHRGGFGWVLSSTARIGEDCAGLRGFTPDVIEDAAAYIDPAPQFPILPPPAEATPEATPGS